MTKVQSSDMRQSSFYDLGNASAPAKVMLFGEHFVVYRHPAILGSIDKRIRVTARNIKPAKINIKSNAGILASFPCSHDKLEEQGLHLSEEKRFLYPLYVAVHDVLKEHAMSEGKNHGVEISVCSDIPWGAGLGSSAASCVATVAAVGSLFLKPEREWVYATALRSERIIHENSSGADCYISTYGGLLYYLKNGQNRKISSARDMPLVILSTKIKHSTKAQVSLVRNFRDRNRMLFNDLASSATCICKKAVSAIIAGNYTKVGNLMTENHALLKELGVSNDEIDGIVRFCMENGAIGAKLTGAGGGGSIVALIPKESQTHFINRVSQKNSVRCFPISVGARGVVIH